MLNITFVQTLFAAMGIAMVIGAVVFLIMPHYRRLGILTLFLSNFPLWSAIALPKKINNFLMSVGFDGATLTEDKKILGFLLGAAVCVALFYANKTVRMKLHLKSDDTGNDDSSDPDNHEGPNEAHASSELFARLRKIRKQE